MSLEGWLNDKKIEKHRSSPREIADLLHICDRDLEKVKIVELGPDWRLSIAHNAAIQTAKAALAATGYRSRKEGQHSGKDYQILLSVTHDLIYHPPSPNIKAENLQYLLPCILVF